MFRILSQTYLSILLSICFQYFFNTLQLIYPSFCSFSQLFSSSHFVHILQNHEANFSIKFADLIPLMSEQFQTIAIPTNFVVADGNYFISREKVFSQKKSKGEFPPAPQFHFCDNHLTPRLMTGNQLRHFLDDEKEDCFTFPVSIYFIFILHLLLSFL